MYFNRLDYSNGKKDCNVLQNEPQSKPLSKPQQTTINITVTSQWARWRPKSPASRLFTQTFIQADQRKHESSASLAFVRGIHRWPVNSPHKWTVTRKMFPFDDVIITWIVCMIHGMYCVNQSFQSHKPLCKPIIVILSRPVRINYPWNLHKIVFLFMDLLL